MGNPVCTEILKGGFSLARLAERCPELTALKEIPQNPEYHGEGDVYRHTEMVCQRLTESESWQSLSSDEQAVLFLAAAFHDIGKSVCTKREDGVWVSPRHTLVGEKLFRRLAYREAQRFGLTFGQRETVAKLIRYHGLPVWFWTKKRPDFELLRAAETIPLRLLYLLSHADVLGRIAEDTDGLAQQVELFADYAKELGIWNNAWTFSDTYTRFQYFHKQDLWPGVRLYNDTVFDVILMAGLPLAGKDTWIETNRPQLPVISLDTLRETMKIPPGKDSGKVVQAALEQARVFLRDRQPFIWNATNLLRETRKKLIALFFDYKARVHIYYLEVPYTELLERNQSRARYIPEQALEEMIRKLEPPEPWEAEHITIVCREQG